MWLKDLRSAVADGVKEFQHGALSEVQQGIAETSTVVKGVRKEIKVVQQKGASAWAQEKKLGLTQGGRGNGKARSPGKAAQGVARPAAAAEADEGWEEPPSPDGSGSSVPLPSMSAIQSMRDEDECARAVELPVEWAGEFSDVPLDELPTAAGGPGPGARASPSPAAASPVPSPNLGGLPVDFSREEPSSLHLPPPFQGPEISPIAKAEPTGEATAVAGTLTEGQEGGDQQAKEDAEEEEEEDLDWGEKDSQRPASAAASKGAAPRRSPQREEAQAAAQRAQAAEQRAAHAQSRLEESMAAAERERARWAEERGRLQRQVAGLQSTVDAGTKEREVLETSVTKLANQLESRLSALSGNVEARDAEVTQLREENESLSSAFEEMRILLKQSVDERSRLNEELLSMERQLARARKEGADAVTALEASKREHMEVSMALAEANANAQQLQATDRAMSAEARDGVQAAAEAARAEAAELCKALEQANARLRKAEGLKEEAESARLEAERARREAQAEVQTAHCAAEAERAQRAEAQGLSEQLKSESERRARVFNNAVKAAVQKIQRELEEQNADLQARVKEAEVAAAMAAEKTAAAEAAAEDAYREAAARNSDAEMAGDLAVTAQEAADRAREKEREAARRMEEAVARCHHAERSREQLATELAVANARTKAAEAEVSRGSSSLAELKETSSARVLALETEASLLRERAEAAAQGAAASSAMADAASKDAETRLADALVAQQKLEKELEEVRSDMEELRASKASRPAFALPSGQEVLAQLGLDKLREERLQLKKGAPRTLESVEAGAAPRKSRSKRSTKVGDVSGLVSTRTWVLIIYAALLHLAVMISYTKRHDLKTICTEYAQEQASSFLPDHIARHGGLP